LVFIDVHMPGMDGFTLVEQMRARTELLTTPIVMFTSAGYPGDGQRCQHLGVNSFLFKPLRQAELFDTIGRILGATAIKRSPSTLRDSVPAVEIRLNRSASSWWKIIA